MVKLSVFLVRHGLDESEGKGPVGILPHMCSIHSPDKAFLDDLTRKVDPSLTEEGYKQAEDTFRALATAFRQSGEKRKMALFSEPLRRCAASAVMISTAGFEPQEWAGWGVTCPIAHKAPTAIPIVVENGFADAQPNIRNMGGYRVVIDGGLIHCAADFWNKAYKKDPIMGVIQEMKDHVQERIQRWLQSAIPTKNMAEYRFAADVQFFKFDKKGDPYSLAPMSLKFNLPSNLLKPNKILEPHRSGTYHSKLPPLPDSASQKALDRAVETARKAGCDTIIIVATAALILEFFDRIDVEIDSIEPGDVIALEAKTKKDGLIWKVHAVAECGQFKVENLPPFEGPLEPSKPPPEDWKKAMEEIGEEKWGLYPPPEPETIPPRYPSIPPFSKCLDLPNPTEKWAWVHHLS